MKSTRHKHTQKTKSLRRAPFPSCLVAGVRRFILEDD